MSIDALDGRGAAMFEGQRRITEPMAVRKIGRREFFGSLVRGVIVGAAFGTCAGAGSVAFQILLKRALEFPEPSIEAGKRAAEQYKASRSRAAAEVSGFTPAYGATQQGIEEHVIRAGGRNPARIDAVPEALQPLWRRAAVLDIPSKSQAPAALPNPGIGGK